MRVAQLVFGNRVAWCMKTTKVLDVVQALKDETFTTTVCAKGDALNLAICNDDVECFEILCGMQPPENIVIHLENGIARHFPYAWEIVLELNAANTYRRLLFQLKKHQIQRKLFARCKATDKQQSPLMMVVKKYIESQGKESAMSYLLQLFDAKFNDEDIKCMFERDIDGHNPFDLVVNNSNPVLHTGMIIAATHWTSVLLCILHRHCSCPHVRKSLTHANSAVPHASTLTLAVISGNYYAVLMLTKWGFSLGAAAEDSMLTNSLYAPAVAIVYALHGMHPSTVLHRQRLQIALHLIRHIDTNVNQYSGTGRKGIAQNRLPNVFRNVAYSQQSLMRLCLNTAASHKHHLLPIINALLERKDLNLQATDPSLQRRRVATKTLVEMAIESKQYGLIALFVKHMRRMCKLQDNTPEKTARTVQSWIRKRWNVDALTNMQTLCAHADRIQQRMWHLVSKRRFKSAARIAEWEDEFAAILDCIKTMMLLDVERHNQSITWFVLSSHRVVENATPRNANWVNMMFEFWHPSMHAQESTCDDASTRGVRTCTYRTIQTILLCVQRNNATEALGCHSSSNCKKMVGGKRALKKKGWALLMKRMRR